MTAEQLLASLMFEHIWYPHHSRVCHICRAAFELGIKPDPGDSVDGVSVDIQRKENAEGDGYFGAFQKGRA